MQPDLTTVFSVLLAFFILLDLLSVAVQTSYSHTNLAKLLALRDQEAKRVHHAVSLVHHLPAVETSLHLTRVFSRLLSIGAILVLLTPLTWTLLSALSFMGYLLIAALVLYLLEEGVEAYVSRQAETWAVRLSLVTRALMFVQSPITRLATLLKTGKGGSSEPQSTVTQDELISMLDAGHEEGLLEKDEREMISSIFRLNDTLAREIMVPRIYITALDVNVTLAEAADALLASGHSRIPVYADSIDNIIGLVYAKDLLRAVHKNNQTDTVRSLLRQVYFVPEAKKVDELLEEMQARQVHMAVVVDEYGGVAGLVTMEDIVEEIVGEIRDEYDQAEELPYQAVGDEEYIFQGRIDLEEFNTLMHTHLPQDEAETLGGFVYNRIGRVPTSGEQLPIDDVMLTVEQVSGRRIRKVRARRLPYPLPSDQEQPDGTVDQRTTP